MIISFSAELLGPVLLTGGTIKLAEECRSSQTHTHKHTHASLTGVLSTSRPYIEEIMEDCHCGF